MRPVDTPVFWAGRLCYPDVVGTLTLELPFFLLLRRGHGPLHRPGNASAGSTGASYRPWDHRRTPPHPAARRRDLPDILPVWSTIGQMALSWPSGGERRSARLPREDAPQAGALRGLSGGSDRHQQAEQKSSRREAAGREWARLSVVLLSLPPNDLRTARWCSPRISSACSGRWSACRSVFFVSSLARGRHRLGLR